MKYKRLSLLLALGVLSGVIFQKSKGSFCFVSFEEGQLVDSYSPSEAINFHQRLSKKKWKIVHRLYKRNLAGRKSRHKKEKIPKIIHQIWLEESPIPEKIALLQTTWKKTHPQWDYQLWTNKEIELLYLQNQDLFEKQKETKKKEELLRLEILYQFGGVFVENLFECTSPLDILHENCDFYAPLTDQIRNPKLSVAIIAAFPKHPVIGKALFHLHNQAEDSFTSEELSSIFTHCFFDTAKKNASLINIALPATFFYSSPNGLEENTKRKCLFGVRREKL